MNKFKIIVVFTFTFILCSCQTVNNVGSAFSSRTASLQTKNDVGNSHEISVLKAQELLTAIGYSTGKPDGILGKETSAAISNFQKDNSLAMTGRLDNSTKKLLTAVAEDRLALTSEAQKRELADVAAVSSEAQKAATKAEYVRPECPNYTQRDMGVVDEMLHVGVVFNNSEKIREGIERGADVHKVVCNTRLSALNADNLRFLANSGFSYKSLCISFAFPYTATSRRYNLTSAERLERMKYLLTQDVDVNCKKTEKFRALHFYYGIHADRKAITNLSSNEIDSFKLLLDAGAKDDIATFIDRGTDGRSASKIRMSSVWAFHTPGEVGLDLISIMLDHGLDPNQNEYQVVNKNGQVLFSYGPTLVAKILASGRPFEKAKIVANKAISMGGDINKGFNSGSHYKNRINTNLLSSVKGDRDRELYILDIGGRYFDGS